ncbi:MAG: ArnT family glycosyltransferase, partial [Flavisolibacter sp.]
MQCNQLASKDYTVAFLTVLGIIGGVTLLLWTRWGIGISTDSVQYIMAARNLLTGHGLSTLSSSGEVIHMTHFPPLFPCLLAAIGMGGMNPLIAARWLNACLFGANILLVGFMINKYYPSPWMSIFGSFLMLSSTVMLHIHSMAWSEPLFIFFGFLGLLILASYLQNLKLTLLFASSGAISLAFLSRYAGLPFVLTGIVGILFLSTERYKRKIVHSVIFGIISCLPLGLWVIRNYYLTRKATNRNLIFHPITINHIEYALSHVSIWLFPPRIPLALRVIFLVATFLGFFVLGAVVMKRKARQKPNVCTKRYLSKIPLLLVAFIVTYVGFLMVSISLFDLYTRLDNRLLSPVYVSAVVIVLSLLQKLLGLTERQRAFKVGVVLICVVLSGLYSYRSIKWFIDNDNYREGYTNYADKRWVQSEIIRKLSSL